MSQEDSDTDNPWEAGNIEDVEEVDMEGRRIHLPLSMSTRILALGVLLIGVFVLSTNTAINEIATGWFPRSLYGDNPPTTILDMEPVREKINTPEECRLEGDKNILLFEKYLQIGLGRPIRIDISGESLVAIGSTKGLQIWNTTLGKAVYKEDWAQPVRCMAWSPSGEHLAAGSLDGILRILYANGTLWKEDRLDSLSNLVWSSANELILGMGDRTVRTYNIQTQDLEKTYKRYQEAEYYAFDNLASFPKILAFREDYETVLVLDLVQGTILGDSRQKEESTYPSHTMASYLRFRA